MINYMSKLREIHRELKFTTSKYAPGLNFEVPEQLMIIKHLKEDDIVLELGGSVGRASCIINYILKEKKNHVVVEPSSIEREFLIKNRDDNNFKYYIEPHVLSEEPLYSAEWGTFKNEENAQKFSEIKSRQNRHRVGVEKIENIHYDDLKKKYNLNFNVLIIDCEGNFVQILKSFPQILNNIRLLQIEHDFQPNGVEGLEYFKKTMIENGFKMTDKFLKGKKYYGTSMPGLRWEDGLRSDPVFVSVWTR